MKRRATLVAVSLALAAPVRMHGQIAGATYCSSSVFDESKRPGETGPVNRMHPLVSRTRYAGLVQREEWALALQGLRLDAMEAFVAAQVVPAHQATFLAQLDTTISFVSRLPPPGDPARPRFISDSIVTVRFRPAKGVSSYGIFRRADRIDVGALGAEQARALCWSAISVDLVLFRLGQPLDLGALARLARLTTAWSNYRTYGYTRQPIEMLLWPGSVHDTLPPRGQFLLGHLSLGQELRGTTLDSLTSNTATVVEVGHLWYRNNFTQYAGASLIGSVASGRTVGYGVLLHVARGIRGGALFRRQGGTTRHSFVVSTDLYGLLEQSKRPVEEGLAVARGVVVLPPSFP